MIDALRFLVEQRESVSGGVQVGGSQLLPLLVTHLQVTAEAMLLACLVAIPPAVWLGHTGRGQLLASSVANAGRAVPSFAVLVFFSAYLGLGITNLVFAMVLLAVPPIFTNTFVGVAQADRDTVDAARGMGLSEARIATRVELPLAVPLVFGGIRTSAINVVATATLGPFVGVVTLGDPIINANVYGDAGRLGGAILVAGLALAFELAFASLQRAATPRGMKLSTTTRRKFPMKTRSALAASLAALALFAVAGCGDDDDGGGQGASSTPAATQADEKVIQRNAENASKPAITVGSKNFTEQFILGEIYAQSLEAAGYKVRRQLNLGSEQIAYKALRGGKVDAYPEYTGTMLTSFYDVDAKDVPKDEDAAYQQARDAASEDDVTALAPTPFTDSNGFAMTREGSQKAGGATKISDLAEEAGDLTLAGPPECRQREDCKLGLEKVYGLKFAKFTPIDLAKRHEVLDNGQADVSLVFTTDGQIKAQDLVLLEDDKQLFPPYNVSFLVRNETLQAAGPDLQEIVDRVQEGLTTEVMQELNSRVDLDKRKPRDVAREYLRESGFIE